MEPVIIICVIVVVLFAAIMAILSRYRKCPSDKVLVIYGKVGTDKNGQARSARCIHGGAAFIVPIIQSYEYMDLTPISINVDLKNALSKQNIRIDVPSRFTVGISTEPGVMQNAAERLLGLKLIEIQELAKDIIFGQLRLIIATMDIEEINSDRDKFLLAVSNNVEIELKKIGLKLINVNVTDITDESGYLEALGKEAAAKAINDAKKSVAEKHRDGEIGQANAQKDQRIQVAAANASAIDGENQAKIEVAQSEALRREREAEALRQATAAEAVQAAKARNTDVLICDTAGRLHNKKNLMEELKKINPKIVFVSLSGFGATGPLKKYPCYDAIAAARGGFAGSNGEPDGATMKAGNANCDTLTGTHALNAALIGLIQARKTGEGCRVDIGMMDTVMISCGETVVDYGKGTYTQSRFGNHDRFTAPYGIFEARDGWAVIIADSEERWAKMCDALDAGHLKDDPRFADNAARIANRDSLVEELEKVTVTYKRSEIEKRLTEAGVPASEVLPFIEAYTSEHANSTETTTLVDQEKIGQMRFYNNPIRFNDELCPIWRGPPLLGEDSREILAGLGYSEEKIDQLFADGVVGSSMI